MKYLLLFFSFLVGAVSLTSAEVLMSQDEALALAFSTDTKIERLNLFPTKEEIEAIENMGRGKLETELITYYKGQTKDSHIGYAFFHTNMVRTMPETFMVVLDENGQVKFIEMLAFFEPPDYLPSKRWFELFEGKDLDSNLWVKRGIRNITGSTLSTHAITKGVRLTLATYNIMIKDKKQ